MNNTDIEKNNDTIIAPDNQPVGYARPAQLGDTRQFGVPEPVEPEDRVPAPLDPAQQPVIADPANVGDVIPVRTQAEGGSEGAVVLATGESDEPILTDPPAVGDAGGAAAQTLPGGNTNQGFVATGTNVGTEAGQPDPNAAQDPSTPAVDPNAAELPPLDKPAGPEVVDSPVDTVRTLGAVSPDGKWYAHSNDGETRAFDIESDRDAYVNSQQGWSAFVNA